MPNIVKVAKLGDVVKEVALSEGATVQTALEAAGYNVEEGYTVTLNGETTSTDTTLKGGDIIILTPKIEGGR